MKPRQAVLVAAKMAGITADDLRNTGRGHRGIQAARKGAILGMREHRIPYTVIADALCLASPESARAIASNAADKIKPGTLADEIWTAIKNGDVPPEEEPSESVDLIYARGSISPRPRDVALCSASYNRGTVITASGSTYVRTTTGKLRWRDKHEGKTFHARGGLY